MKKLLFLFVFLLSFTLLLASCHESSVTTDETSSQASEATSAQNSETTPQESVASTLAEPVTLWNLFREYDGVNFDIEGYSASFAQKAPLFSFLTSEGNEDLGYTALYIVSYHPQDEMKSEGAALIYVYPDVDAAKERFEHEKGNCLSCIDPYSSFIRFDNLFILGLYSPKTYVAVQDILSYAKLPFHEGYEANPETSFERKDTSLSLSDMIARLENEGYFEMNSSGEEDSVLEIHEFWSEDHTRSLTLVYAPEAPGAVFPYTIKSIWEMPHGRAIYSLHNDVGLMLIGNGTDIDSIWERITRTSIEDSHDPITLHIIDLD